MYPSYDLIVSVRVEKMTDCEGHCEPGEPTSLGVMKFMKFCGEAPCGITNEMCTVDCEPDDTHGKYGGVFSF